MHKFNAVTAAFMAAVSFSVILPANAQVEVVDLDVPSTRFPSDQNANGVNSNDGGYSPRTAKPSPASMTEFYFQLQTLQQEVQTLRGLVEEQSYQLKKLKQQRLDDYLDLDRRVSGLSQATSGSFAKPAASGSSNTGTPNTASQPSSAAPAQSSGGSAEDELSLYRSGIDAVLKQRDYDKGIESFDAYLRDYPSGVYAANAKYWLGQVYLQREDLDSAQQWFNTLVQEHPNHQKTPEAKFKLAKVLFLQGDLDEAQTQLQAVVSSGSSAAKLAQDFLDKNY